MVLLPVFLILAGYFLVLYCHWVVYLRNILCAYMSWRSIIYHLMSFELWRSWVNFLLFLVLHRALCLIIILHRSLYSTGNLSPWLNIIDDNLWKLVAKMNLKVILINIFQKFAVPCFSGFLRLTSFHAVGAVINNNPYSQHHPRNWVGEGDDEEEDDDEGELYVQSTPQYHD